MKKSQPNPIPKLCVLLYWKVPNFKILQIKKIKKFIGNDVNIEHVLQ